MIPLSQILCYTFTMKSKPLIETNPYLQDKNLYEKLLTLNVSSSTAIEIGSINPALVKALKRKNAPKLIYPIDEK